jgi:hypothetical protein
MNIMLVNDKNKPFVASIILDINRFIPWTVHTIFHNMYPTLKYVGKTHLQVYEYSKLIFF